MSLARKQALISSAVWLVITVVFAVMFFSAGAAAFAEAPPSGIRSVVALLILLGFLVNIVALYRSRRGRRQGKLDERDAAIARLASEVTLIILAVLVFSLSLGLFEVYREAGAVPAGWLYFMAYGTMALISLLHPVVSLVLDYGGKVDG